MKNYNEIVKTVLHVHPGGTPNDAVAPEKDYVDAAKAAGYRVMTATEHGGFTPMQTLFNCTAGMDDFRIVYGVEAYIEIPPFSIDEKVGHMILLACNEKGKHAIDRLVSNGIERRVGNATMLVVTYDMLVNDPDVKGNVLATSACVSGAPAMALLVNDFTEELIRREEARLGECTEDGVKKCMSSSDPEYLAAVKAHEANIERVRRFDEAIKGEDTKAARRVLTKARTQVKTRIKAGEATDADLAEAECRIEEFDANIDRLKAELEAFRGEFRVTQSRLTTLNKKRERYDEIKARVDGLKARLIPEDAKQSNAEKEMLRYADIFGRENYYVELQYHGLAIEREVYPVLARLAKKNGLKVIASNDVHVPYNRESDLTMREVARVLRFRKKDDKEHRAADREMYLKTPDELARALLKILPEDIVDEAMLNLNEIEEKCTYVPVSEKHYPKFCEDAPDVLVKEAKAGINWRFPDGEGWDDEHEQRLYYELDTINKMGFADYLLIVKDFIEYGRIIGVVPEKELHLVPLTIEGAREYVAVHKYRTGIGIGPGRGSGGGSLVLYLLGITSIDPLKFNLIFERFLNPERITMPDIDTDFAVAVREKCIEYTRHKYGKKAVVGIVTQNREGVKGALRDAATYRSVMTTDDDQTFSSLGDRMRKKVPEGAGVTFSMKVEAEEVLPDGSIECGRNLYRALLDEFESDADAKAIIETAACLEGMLCSFGQHAAGVVIYDGNDINDYIPTMKNKDGEAITCMNMVQVEEQEMLKMDFLGLKNLSICTDTVKSIEARTGKVIDLVNDISFEGREADEVYRHIYAAGNTKDVFQFESAGMRNYLKQLSPTCIEDIIAMNALYRPGPMDAIPEYIENKKAQAG